MKGLTILERTETVFDDTALPELDISNPDVKSVGEDDAYDVIVVGGGPAGLTAGLYSSRAGLSTLVLEGDFISSTLMPGGQLLLTPEIENYPGFPKGSGYDLIEIMRNQTEAMGAEIITAQVDSFSLDGLPYVVHTQEGATYRGRTVILATGAVARRLGVPGEDKFFGKGVSTCATCDGAFFRDKDVVVVGGGDTAIEDGMYMTNIARSVTLVHRRDQLRSTGPAAQRFLEHPKVSTVWNSQVTEVFGGKTVDSVKIENSAGEESILPASALFIAIGHDPATECLHNEGESLVELDGFGYVKLFGGTHTSIPGVFAAGDLADSVYRQAITAAATGCQAALDAQRYLMEG